MKLNAQLAARVRDEVFNEEERVLLSTVEGATYIDIADQLLLSYGDVEILERYADEGQFIKACAILKFREGKYILEQLRTLNTELENLMNPKRFYKEGASTSYSNTNLVNDFTSKNTTIDTAGSFSYDFSESSAQNKSSALVRGASTQTSEKNKGIENKWKKDALLDVSVQVVGKKEFDPNKVLQQEKVLDVREAHYEIIPQEQQEQEDIGGSLYSTLSVGLTGNATSNYGAANNETLALSRGDGVTDSTSNTYSNTDFNMHKDYSSYVHNDAAMKAIRLSIPNLQNKFFTIFGSLFNL